MMKKTLLILFLFVGALGSILQAQTVLTGYSENFNHKFGLLDSAFWAPSSKMFATDTLVFTVTQDAVTPTDSTLSITERQADFADGQMFDFLTAKNSVLDLSANPYMSFKLKIDSADWRAPDWGQGGKAVPQTVVPFGLSVWSGDTRLAGGSFDVPIDGQWHEYFYTFVTNPQVDLSQVGKILIESVTWNLGTENVHNKCYYKFDDFKAGDLAAVTAVTDVAITGASDVTTNGTVLNLGTSITPADATFSGVIWQLIKGTGNAKLSASGVFTPVADGTMKVVALATDGSGLTDTVTITMTNQTDVVTTFNENFSAPDLTLWQGSSKPYSGDTLVFTVTSDGTALHVMERQADFADGEFISMKQNAGKIVNMTDNPFISFRLKVDSADWRAPDWGQGGKAVPQTTVPFGISPWNETASDRLAQASFNLPIDGLWHNYYISFVADPSIDLSAVSKILVESVTWNLGSENVHNKVYYWMDDFKLGLAATPPSQAETFTVSGKDGVTEITTPATTLQMVGTFDPVDATLQDVIWKINNVTGYAKIDAASGVLTPISDGTVDIIGLTKDGSALSDTVTITLSNQTLVKTGYTQNFNAAANFDINLWQPNSSVFGNDTLEFAVSLEANAAHVFERQSSFADGQMYNLKKFGGFVVNMTDNPFASIDVKVDSADWRAPDWGQGGKAVPQTTMPFGLSVWNETAADRLSGGSATLPLDGQWHTYYFTFAAIPALDLSAISKILMESVTWNLGSENVHNSAAYWMDNFKLGTSVSIPTSVEEITVSNTMGLDSITTVNGTLTLKATVLPDTATFKSVIWTSADTLIANVDQNGKVTAKDVDGDVVITATAKDGSGISGTYAVHALVTAVRGSVISQFKLYPNPATDFLRINGAERINSVTVTNVTGQIVLKETLNGSKNEINISGLNKGLYMVRIVDKDGSAFVRNFIKQ